MTLLIAACCVGANIAGRAAGCYDARWEKALIERRRRGGAPGAKELAGSFETRAAVAGGGPL